MSYMHDRFPVNQRLKDCVALEKLALHMMCSLQVDCCQFSARTKCATR